MTPFWVKAHCVSGNERADPRERISQDGKEGVEASSQKLQGVENPFSTPSTIYIYSTRHLQISFASMTVASADTQMCHLETLVIDSEET